MRQPCDESTLHWVKSRWFYHLWVNHVMNWPYRVDTATHISYNESILRLIDLLKLRRIGSAINWAAINWIVDPAMNWPCNELSLRWFNAVISWSCNESTHDESSISDELTIVMNPLQWIGPLVDQMMNWTCDELALRQVELTISQKAMNWSCDELVFHWIDYWWLDQQWINPALIGFGISWAAINRSCDGSNLQWSILAMSWPWNESTLRWTNLALSRLSMIQSAIS
jgi:hypothetical protein